MNPLDAQGRYRLPFWVPITRMILWLIFRPLIHILFKVEVRGRENIPPRSPFMIAYNHISVLEPALVMAFWPYFPEAIAGADVWQRGGQVYFVGGYGAIPIKRGAYDRHIFDIVKAVFAAALPLAISPEGGRSHKKGMRRALPGVAYMMELADVPIIPVAITGTSDEILARAFKNIFIDLLLNRRAPMRIEIGPSFRLPPIEGKGEARRESRQANADRVMLKIAAMLPEDYHGAYEGMKVPDDP